MSGTGDLLVYDSRHKVMICRECMYAVQKSALSSHLLRHKIYRGERQRLLSSIQGLDVLEPEDVVLPPLGSPPVDGLPVLAGYRCTSSGCGVLCASSKRMRRHWSEAHGVPDPPNSAARPAKLQTFFRGTKLRYFEVFVAESPNVPPATPLPVEAGPGTGLDLVTLRYFHHFMTATSLTLPVKDNAAVYWQVDAVTLALQHSWLMSGVLALSAYHLAMLADNETSKQLHKFRVDTFLHGFATGRTGIATAPDVGSRPDIASLPEARQGAQLSCIMRCYWTALGQYLPRLDNSEAVRSQLRTFTRAVRGCSDQQYALQVLLSERDVAGGLQGQNNPPAESDSSTAGAGLMPPALLEHFRTLPYRMTSVVGKPDNAMDFFATVSALTAVEECCSMSFASGDLTTTWKAMELWLTKVHGRFLDVVWKGSLAAMIVFAQWTLLVERTERHCWLLKGATAKLREAIEAQLPKTDAFRSLMPPQVLE